MFAYIHKKCGKPAWLLHYEPTPGKSFLSQQCYSLSNKPLNFSFGCRCESCGEMMFEDAATPPSAGNVVKISDAAIKHLSHSNEETKSVRNFGEIPSLID